MSATQALLGLGVLLQLTGCGSSTQPQATRQLAVIAHAGEPALILAPDTVTAGVPFEVTVGTYGGGCVSEGDTDVEVVDRVVSVTPYDIDSGGSACTADALVFPHRVAISIVAAGPLELRVRGRDLPSDTLIVVERQIIVN